MNKQNHRIVPVLTAYLKPLSQSANINKHALFDTLFGANAQTVAVAMLAVGPVAESAADRNAGQDDESKYAQGKNLENAHEDNIRFLNEGVQLSSGGSGSRSAASNR